MRLKRNITASGAIAVLTERLTALEQTRGQHRERLLAKYLDWAHLTEIKYGEIFADNQMLVRLMSQRHWHIRAHGSAEDLAVGPGVFHQELDAQQRILTEAIAELLGSQMLAGRPGELFVLDTNTLLHYRRFDEIKWLDELNARSVRLVIPLVVLDEVDEKTYASNPRLAGRAESVLRALDTHIDAAVDNVSEVRPQVTLEILNDPPDHVRSTDKDHEILNRAEFLVQVTEQSVVVVSGDRGMRVRGRARGMTVWPLQPSLRHALQDDANRG